jgi:hypothetical protein
MYRFARDEGIDLEDLRARLRKMTDEDLVRFGKAARFMCGDKSPRQAFVIQLEEAGAEWRRRHPKPRAASTDLPHRTQISS